MKHNILYVINGVSKKRKKSTTLVLLVFKSNKVIMPSTGNIEKKDSIGRNAGTSCDLYILEGILINKVFLNFLAGGLLAKAPIIGVKMYAYASKVYTGAGLGGNIKSTKYAITTIRIIEQTILILLKVQNISSAELWIFSTVLLLLAIELKYASASSLLESILGLFTLLAAFILFYQFSNKYTQNNIIKRSNNK